jgi:hypothetical protein
MKPLRAKRHRRAEDESERVNARDHVKGRTVESPEQIIGQRGEGGVIAEQRRHVTARAMRVSVNQPQIVVHEQWYTPH